MTTKLGPRFLTLKTLELNQSLQCDCEHGGPNFGRRVSFDLALGKATNRCDTRQSRRHHHPAVPLSFFLSRVVLILGKGLSSARQNTRQRFTGAKKHSANMFLLTNLCSVLLPWAALGKVFVEYFLNFVACPQTARIPGSEDPYQHVFIIKTHGPESCL